MLWECSFLWPFDIYWYGDRYIYHFFAFTLIIQEISSDNVFREKYECPSYLYHTGKSLLKLYYQERKLTMGNLILISSFLVIKLSNLNKWSIFLDRLYAYIMNFDRLTLKELFVLLTKSISVSYYFHIPLLIYH